MCVCVRVCVWLRANRTGEFIQELRASHFSNVIFIKQDKKDSDIQTDKPDNALIMSSGQPLITPQLVHLLSRLVSSLMTQAYGKEDHWELFFFFYESEHICSSSVWECMALGWLTLKTFKEHSSQLTLCGIDEVLPIFVQFFDKPVSFVQLCFVCLDFLPEAGAVQIAFTEFQRV